MYPNIPQQEVYKQCVKMCETRFDKSIFSNSLCNSASIILKKQSNENGSLKYHQKRSFVVGAKFASPYSNLFLTGLEKRIF